MHTVKNTEKTGFAATCEKIKIFDKSRRLFYVRVTDGSEVNFNLPKGKFYSNTPLKKLSEPLEYKTVNLPPREKLRARPDFIKKKYAENPNKASIVLMKNIYVIILDKSLRNAGRLYNDFVTLHELGHHLYKQEIYADRFAYKCMIKQGYNPSQIFYAAYIMLNKYVSRDRIKEMLFTTHFENTYIL